jgi:hypothetical protein
MALEAVPSDSTQEKTTRRKGYQPKDEDYHIERISIDEAENGVMIRCSYTLNEDVKDKMKKQRDGGLEVPYWGGCEDETHVFQSKEEAKNFILGELNELWTGESGDKRS